MPPVSASTESNCAFVDGRLVSIADKKVEESSASHVVEVSSSSPIGVITSLQTAGLILARASQKVLPGVPFVLRHAFGLEFTTLNAGYYAEIGTMDLSDATQHARTIDEIKKEAMNIVKANHPITFEVLKCDEARKRFEEQGCYMSISYIETDNSPSYECYTLDGYTVLRSHPLAPSTNIVEQGAKLTIEQYHRGLVLSFSDIPQHMDCAAVNGAFDRALKWSTVREEGCVGYVNKHIVEGKPHKFVAIQEHRFDGEVMHCAEAIKIKSDDVKLILIAGPSASGKTTFAAKLALSLRALGFEPHVLGTDDYYRDNRDPDYPRTPDGKLDYETVEALRLDVLNQHLNDLFQGKEIDVPIFDFVKSRPKEETKKMRIPSNGVLIMEGIFSLDPRMTAQIPDDKKFKIFITPLPQTNFHEAQFLSNQTVRTLRRISRDHLHRGRSAAASIGRLQGVRSGEERNIFPTLKYADFVFNSHSSHELSVLSVYCKPLLEVVGVSDPTYPEAQLLIDVLDKILPVSDHSVSSDSLLREFIGGSSFEMEEIQIKSDTHGDGRIIGKFVEVPPAFAMQSRTVQDAVDLVMEDEHHVLKRRDSWCAVRASHMRRPHSSSTLSQDRSGEEETFGTAPPTNEDGTHAKEDVIAALIDCEMFPLSYPLDPLRRSAYVSPVYVNSNPGMQVYRATVTFLMHVAVKLLYPDLTCVIPHGFGAEGSRLSSAYFVEVFQDIERGELVQNWNEDNVLKVFNKMKLMVEEETPITYEIVSTAEAAEYFDTAKMYMSKELVLSRNLNAVALAVCDGIKVLMMQPLAPNLSFVPHFRLESYPSEGGAGMAICFPTLEEPTVVAPPPALTPAIESLEAYRKEVISAQRTRCVGEVNRYVFEGKGQNMVRINECLTTLRMRRIVRQVADKGVRVVLIAGPSSSGKSVFADQLLLHLESNGYEARTLTMDNYYKNLADEDYPLTASGDKDCESIDAMRLDVLQKDVMNLLDGKDIQSPTFDLGCGKIQEATIKIEGLPKNGVLVMEGLFAINDKLLADIPREKKMLMLVTPLPLVNLDELRFTSNQVLRTLRRIVRDYRTRGRDARETLTRWGAVGEGEERNTIPFMDKADIIINASSVFEIGAIRGHATTLLERVIFQYPREYTQATWCLKMLSWFHDVPEAAQATDGMMHHVLTSKDVHHVHH